ncbi:MAG: dipeptidase, partial [Halanaerobiales bacterium]
GIILGLEGGNSILNLSTLNVFYRMGVRLLSLTWNHNNHLAGGILPRKKDMGLSKMGKEVIELMNRLGIIIDVSHLGRRSFYDVLKVSTGPLVASHANAYQICSHPRNLTDHQITALAKRKGLIGVNFYPPFLNNSQNAKIIDVIRHIDYIRELVGEKYIGLGSDFDGIDCTPENLYDISTVPELFSTLSERNYSDRQIDMLGQDNWLRVCKSILGG